MVDKKKQELIDFIPDWNDADLASVLGREKLVHNEDNKKEIVMENNKPVEENIKESNDVARELINNPITLGEHRGFEEQVINQFSEKELNKRRIPFTITGDDIKKVEGHGSEIRSLLPYVGYRVKHGVQNRNLERACLEALQQGINLEENPIYIGGLKTYLGRNVLIWTGNNLKKLNQAIDIYPIPEEIKYIKETNMKEEIKTKKIRNYETNNWAMYSTDMLILFLRSAQWAFWICLLGVIGESFHLYHVFTNISDLVGWAKWGNAGLLAVFFSFGLMIFTLRLGAVEETNIKRIKEVKKKIYWFIALSVFANLYYWSWKFVLMPGVLDQYMGNITDPKTHEVYRDIIWANVKWFTFNIQKVQWPQEVAAIILSFALPFVIKAFAGEIRLPKFLDDKFRKYE